MGNVGQGLAPQSPTCPIIWHKWCATPAMNHFSHWDVVTSLNLLSWRWLYSVISYRHAKSRLYLHRVRQLLLRRLKRARGQRSTLPFYWSSPGEEATLTICAHQGKIFLRAIFHNSEGVSSKSKSNLKLVLCQCGPCFLMAARNCINMFLFKARDGKCHVPARCRSVLNFLWWWRELDLGLTIAACRISTHTKLKLVSLMWPSRSNRKYWPNLTNSMNFTPQGKIAHLAWSSRWMKPKSDTITQL